ncbi:MAG: DoxX-like family protein [Tateyamaria sp.]|uniref:DoxX-like family protein n=1 Tax=Tateyamaria sp. TaxID=1929288 RepID=UPI003293750B
MADANGPAHAPKAVLIIGAYGLIGSGIAQHLTGAGHQVIGFGRQIDTGKRVLPTLEWRSGDMRFLIKDTDWTPLLADVDVVVNCSGALQDGPQDDLEIVHHHAIAALANACAARGVQIIQISATGADLDASTPFLASKARGDAAIQRSGAHHVILRPGLVLARHSYGGSAMLRMLAAVPWVQPIALPDAKIQTIGLDDLAATVSAAVSNALPDGFVGDLVEAETHSLRDVVASMRSWLGFAPAKAEIAIPKAITQILSKAADALALLGWRSPLRTTAVRVLGEGVTGVHQDLSRFGLPPIKSLQHTLAHMPARVEDRLFARMSLLTPIIVATLVVFWFLSGAIGFLRASQAALVLQDAGWSQSLALASVLFWAVVDIAIAAAFAYRSFAKQACWCAVAVSLFYLGASTLFVPSLWLDPLGPLIKIFPGITLALIARAALETR